MAYRLGGFFNRRWLALSLTVQAILTLAAALSLVGSGLLSIAPNRDEPAWTSVAGYAALALGAASLGVQGATSNALATPFGNSVVLTTVWLALVTDPKLFDLRHAVKGRDQRALAVAAMSFGAFFARALVQQIGSSPALGLAAGIKILTLPLWLSIKAKARPVDAKT